MLSLLSNRGRWLAVVATALLVCGMVFLAIHPGLKAHSVSTHLPADGREHLVAEIQARYHLPLHANDLHVAGAQDSRLRLEDRSGTVALWLRTPVQQGNLRLHVSGAGSSLALPIQLEPEENDSFHDGTPDWMRLHAATDREAFRRWFTEMAERAADNPAGLPTEITDCASLLRYAYREALRVHDDRWYQQFPPEQMPALDSVQQWSYPNTPLGVGLFRVRPGSFRATDATDGTFTQFADAKTLLSDNAYLLGRDLRAARPGDLIFYRLLERDSQYHSMIVAGEHGKWVVYHTGPANGGRGEMRRVLLTDLLHHPDPSWRPQDSNANFLGVYRWNILREQ